MVASVRKSKYRFLDPTAAEDIAAEAVPLGGVFQLARPRFKPLKDADVPKLNDGEKPTVVGKALMELWGAANDQDWRECPTDFVRAVEAVSSTDDNADRIRQAIKGPSARWERNHAGIFSAVVIDVLVPAVGVATVQPRGNTRYGRSLHEEHGEPIIHEIGEGLTLSGRSAAHFEHIRSAQKEVIEPGRYRDERRDFVESIALEGIREPLRGFVYHLTAPSGQHSHLVETDDGYTRVAVAQYLISALLHGLPADFSRLPWENGDGTQTVRGWTADKIRQMHEYIEFAEAPFDVWPESETPEGVEEWINDSSLAAKAVMRTMTARMSIGVKIKPHARHTTHDVVYADMARLHVKGHQPAPWDANDDEAFKARTIISNLTRDGFIDASERGVFLGTTDLPWLDTPNAVPFRNRLVATVEVLTRVVVEDPKERERYPAVRRILKGLQVPNSPTQAASAAASLAAQIAGLTGGSETGAFIAMLRRSFSNSHVRRVAEHGEDWTAVVNDDLDAITEKARDELARVLGSNSHANYLGPNMRALALLAMVAHGMNPRLIGYLEKKQDRLVRSPQSMTINGRAGRAGGGAADAHTVVFHMARSPQGIDELHAIAAAVTEHVDPILPLDPSSGIELLEDELRRKWGKNPDRDGRPRALEDDPVDDEEGEDSSQPGDSGGLNALGLSDVGRWNSEVATFRDELRALATKADVFAQAPVGPEALGIDHEDWDPDEVSYPKMIDAVGIEDSVCEEYDEDANIIRKFFGDGRIAWFRNRTRSS